MKSKKLNIIGAGGHARSIISSFKKDYNILGLYDDTFSSEINEKIFDYPLKGNLNDVPINEPITISISNLSQRIEIFENHREYNFLNLIHSTALIQEPLIIGTGNQFFPNSFINGGSRIGDNNIFNTSTIIEHEAQIGSHCHFSIGSVIAGRVEVGNNVFIGANATVIDGVKICNNVIIGAGAVVLRNIKEPGIYAGNPIKKIK